ncbi:hypothetical protein ABZM97_20375 [Bacillus vallismortis]|uniref:hypothetical protein n=1 Tax=Bacillus vallismortis TaxID=72361 RepID=UPI00202A439F|nr:hypothetical protein [Bacillus subtilis]MDM5303838.1 hypothetical protein [Bacillus subtilis]MDM5325891.1 hypothetical protein [Bacillus subtilis]
MMKEGETAKGLNYEVGNMQAGSQTIHLSLDVMNIMDNVREQWGTFEYENIGPL